MSAIFGLYLQQDSLLDEESLSCLGQATSRYGVDGTAIYVQGRLGMAFQAFHTHGRSRLEQQPIVDLRSNILVLDGRLDNHRELAATEGIKEESVSDSALILMAFARWGTDCFSHLVGDWALALWSATDRVLYLARDHAGSRTLFYRNMNGETCWSSYLETFFVGGEIPQLNQEYIIRVLSSQAVGELTPYEGIKAVPPAHYITIREGEITIRPHWHSIADISIVYRSESEYDEHFIHLFRNAVQRRVGSGARVLAELSGGMDSSSIVCMADHIVEDGPDPSDLFDTISYYDDTEPDWNERPYFAAVEKRRHKVGIHLDCSSRTPSYQPLVLPDRIYPYPGRDSSSFDFANQFEQTIGPGRYRAILSGFGGDELLGGVPTPMPELADYLRTGRLFKLILRASEWCAIGRQPLIHMLHDTATFTNSLYRDPRDLKQIRPPWLSLGLQQMRLRSYAPNESMRALLMARPSAIANGRAWWALVENLPHLAPHLVGCYEYRYPYLDRDLVEFLHRVPRAQLAQPGRRRFLMRRALKRIVPPEILERKRKAQISRRPIVNLRSAHQRIEELFANPLSSDAGLVDRDKFLLAFRSELAGDLRWVGPLIKTISIELWLQSLTESYVSLRVASHSRDSNELPTASVSQAPRKQR